MILIAEITVKFNFAVALPRDISVKSCGNDEVLRIDLFSPVHLVEVSDLMIKESLYTEFGEEQTLSHAKQFLYGK